MPTLNEYTFWGNKIIQHLSDSNTISEILLMIYWTKNSDRSSAHSDPGISEKSSFFKAK